jgi:hypothetical protein
VKIAPPLKEKICGFKFTKELAVPTTFAAIFDAKTAKITPINAKRVGNKPPIKLITSIGSEIARPNMVIVADVTATPMKLNAAMKSGRPIAWPAI